MWFLQYLEIFIQFEYIFFLTQHYFFVLIISLLLHISTIIYILVKLFHLNSFTCIILSSKQIHFPNTALPKVVPQIEVFLRWITWHLMRGSQAISKHVMFAYKTTYSTSLGFSMQTCLLSMLTLNAAVHFNCIYIGLNLWKHFEYGTGIPNVVVI